MKKIPKGTFGYTDAHKKQQLLKTFIFFLLPLAIFLTGCITTKTKQNYFTVVAVVGCLPACKEMVNVLMFLKRSSMPEKLYQEIASHTEGSKGMETAYELVLTTYEKSYPIAAVAIKGNEVIGYTDTAKETDWKAAEEHIRKILKQNGIPKAHVHIFQDLPQFLERIDALAAQKKENLPFTPDERYPNLTREQVIREVILALSI
ncbi:MAG: hypothetical protein HFI19_16980 [Lachnospiraceae bacterium]|nr:hypothetical protein [Lachnospiraceae bacterium]